MHVTDAPQPTLAVEDVQQILLGNYGIAAALKPLVSERDQNFLVLAEDGRRFVAKLANACERPEVTAFQVEALRYLERSGCPVTIPRVIPALDGEFVKAVASGDHRHNMRLVTWVPGEPLIGRPPDIGLAYRMGGALARIDAGLEGFAHPGEQQELLWDMQRAPEVRDRAAHVPDAELRARVTRCFDDFETRALPGLPALRRQVIHNDLNPGNVLLTGKRPRVAGVIDFGDMVRAPLVIDVAVAASYLRPDDEDALGPAAALVAGFSSVTALSETELSLVYTLVRTRLATTIVMMYSRLSARAGEDAYARYTLRDEGSAARFLARLEALGERAFGERLTAVDRRLAAHPPE